MDGKEADIRFIAQVDWPVPIFLIIVFVVLSTVRIGY
jgi:hypothetical protein